MARRKTNNKIGCLAAIIVVLVLPLIVYFAQKPKGPEVPFDRSVAKNSRVYFDPVSITLKDSTSKVVTSKTRRTVRTGMFYRWEYLCTTTDGDEIILYVERNTLDSSSNNTGFNPDSAIGKRIHGVTIGESGTNYVLFESVGPRE